MVYFFLGSFFLSSLSKARAYTDLPRIGTRSCGALDKTITFLWKDAFENDPSGMNVGTWRLVVELCTSQSEVCAVTTLLGQTTAQGSESQYGGLVLILAQNDTQGKSYAKKQH